MIQCTFNYPAVQVLSSNRDLKDSRTCIVILEISIKLTEVNQTPALQKAGGGWE